MKKSNRKVVTYVMVAAIFGLSILAQSCEKEEFNMEEMASPTTKSATGSEYSPRDYATIDSMITCYSMLVTHCMENAAFRAALKSEAMTKFDDDYDVLATTLQKQTLTTTGQSVYSLLVNAYETLYTPTTGIPGDEYLQRVNRTIPNLQVAIPVNCKEWNTESHRPAVIPLPYTFDDKMNRTIAAYNNIDDYQMVSLDEEPTIAYAVVGISERITIDGLRRKDLFVPSVMPETPSVVDPFPMALHYPDSLMLMQGESNELQLRWSLVTNATKYVVFRKQGGQYLPIATTAGNNNIHVDTNLTGGQQYWYAVRAVRGTDTSAYSPIKTTFAADRANGDELLLLKLKYTKTGLNQVEPWIKGGPETHVTLVNGRDSSKANIVTEFVLEPSRKDVKDKWWNHQCTLLPSWHLDYYNACMKIAFTEDDFLDDEYTISASYEDKLHIGESGTIKFGGTAKITTDDITGQIDLFFWSPSQVMDIGGNLFFQCN